MATLIEYLDQSDILKTIAGNPDLTPIGYLTTNPSQTLRNLLPNFYVVDYLGISIPSRSEAVNYNNHGLRISAVADGIGLIGTIEMLNQSDLFKSCRHEPFSDEQRKQLAEKMRSRLHPRQQHQEPLHHPQAEKYVLIFDVLGHPISVDQLIKFTTHKNYFDHVPNGGILLPEDLPRFP